MIRNEINCTLKILSDYNNENCCVFGWYHYIWVDLLKYNVIIGI